MAKLPHSKKIDLKQTPGRAVASAILLSLLVGLTTLAPHDTFGAPSNCSKAFSFFKAFRNFIPMKVESPAEIRSLSERPKEIILRKYQTHSIEDFAEMGYAQDYRPHKKEELHFVRVPELLTEEEAKPLSPNTQKQRAAFIQRFGNWGEVALTASSREKWFAETPQYEHLLTAKTLQKIPPGRYSFVVLKGENFLRIGMGHHILGARRTASSAGEVQIDVDPHTGIHSLSAINARSDTYRPSTPELLPALDAIWRQGVPTEKLKILHWNQDLLLQLE
jgi:hypothetical protein